MSAGKFATQDPKILSLFEVVGSYFADTVFNHLWSGARSNLVAGGSVTDEFRRRASAYVLGVKNDNKCYSEVIDQVHRYFTNTTRFTTMGFAEFVDRVVSTCVPPEYYSHFTTADKDELLSSLVCTLVGDLVAFVTTDDMLRRIIDNHTVAPEVTVRMIQDAALSSLFAKRSGLLNKFYRKAGQSRDHVSMDTVDDMKKALLRLVKEKTDAVARAARAEKANHQLAADLSAAKARAAKLEQLVALMRAGRDRGPAAAVALRRVPGRDRLAEVDDPLEPKSQRGPAAAAPRRDRLAENNDSDSGEDSEPARERPRRGGKPTIGRDFFRGGTKPVPAESEPAPRGGMMASLLDGVEVDDDAAMNADADADAEAAAIDVDAEE